MKKVLLLFVCLICCLYQARAQSRTVTGTVTSGEDGTALPGVNVIVKGTSVGTTSDNSGRYSLTVESDNTILVFSFIGFQTTEITVGARTVVDVTMESDVKQLSEIVVTANAIEREMKSIGYAVSTVGGDELTKARETNVLNALTGKIAGVNITNQTGTVGGSTRILIRGANSFEGSNQPLFVVDGVPISNQNYNGNNNNRTNGGIDVGNRASDINPDDIASITVLKGAAATALYGSRAKDGAIIITSKRGSNRTKSFVTINSSYRFDTPFRLPDFQNEYGPGNFGKFAINGASAGWGPKISEVSNSTFTDWTGEEVTLQAYPDNVKDFYNTGKTMINSVSLAGGDANMDYRISYTQQKQTGIVPNNSQDRNVLSLNTGIKLPNKFSSRIGINYAKTTSTGRPATGGNNSNVLSSIVNLLPRTTNINDVRQYKNEDGSQRALDQFTNNPFWVANENEFTSDVERVYGFAQVGYDPFSWLNLTGRVGSDFFSENRRRINRKGTVGFTNGQFILQELFTREINTDIIATVTKKLATDINLTALAGFNVNQRSFRFINVQSDNLTIDQLYSFSNASSNAPTNYSEMRRLYGAYADIGLSYKDYLFVNVTGRNDWSSTLPENQNSYFYPSVSSSFVFTQAFDISNDILSYGKLRGNIAQVGSDENPYSLNFTYTPLSTEFVQYLPGNTYPINGSILAFSGPATIPPRNLKPQRQTSWEIGTELQFFNGRIGVDFTYYNTVTSDQIVSIPIPESTGYSVRRDNVGEISNKGIELLLTGTPVSLANGFKWDVAFNFARNRQTVNKLTEGLEEYVITAGFNFIQIKAKPNKPLQLYGNGWARDEETNEVLIDPNTGLRIPGGNVLLGNIYPDFTLGIQNTFSYKGLSLSVLVDMRKGGVINSLTTSLLRTSGVAAETAFNREGTFIDRGVIDNGDGTTRPNDVPVTSMEQFWSNYSRNTLAESSTFGASYAKLREIRLGYQLPKTLLQNLPFGSVEFAVEGRNLLLLYSEIPHIDPEIGSFGSAVNGEGFDVGGALPTTRSIGFNVRVTF